MRALPFADRSFGGVTSFFTSFGYFADPKDDRRVLREMRRVLRERGSFMLDFLNADRVRRDLVAEDAREIDGARIMQRRSIAGSYVVKSILIEPAEGGAPREFEERVRLYAPEDLTEMLRQAGFVTTQQYGDYSGGPLTESSPRLILAGWAMEDGGSKP
jgi:ubiquinone/menaquinone biosynthesis C-methylase UbiE